MRTATHAILALAVLALPSCRGREQHAPLPTPPRAQVLKDVPKYPRSLLFDTTGSVAAEQQRYTVQARFDSVTAFFRERLPALGWQFMGGTDDSMRLDVLAQRGDTSLWLHVERLGSLASQYTLIGSVVRQRSPRPDSGR
jgi:hypothetical protein